MLIYCETSPISISAFGATDPLSRRTIYGLVGLLLAPGHDLTLIKCFVTGLPLPYTVELPEGVKALFQLYVIIVLLQCSCHCYSNDGFIDGIFVSALTQRCRTLSGVKCIDFSPLQVPY